MKTPLLFLASLTLFGLVADGQNNVVPGPQTLPVAASAYRIGERGPHHRVWQKITTTTNAFGRIFTRTNQAYVELATGMHHWQKGKWVASSDQIEILPEGDAAATNGQHQVYFPSDIYDGVIRLVTPEGKLLVSRPLGLSYFDGSNSVLIAELTNSVGEILPSGNQVIYPNAFGFADLRYTYSLAGFEQDVILRARPPAPEEFGLDPARTRLQVLTEFFSPPRPAVHSAVMAVQAGVSLADDRLDFGAMKVGTGRAFVLGNESRHGTALIAKQWTILDRRQFLVEETPLVALADSLALLPASGTHASLKVKPRAASRRLQLPAQRLARNESRHRIQLASIDPAPGLVLDYTTVNSSQTNFTFQGDTTYYIKGAVNLYGTNVLEGGAVLKYTNGSSSILTVYGSLRCNTGPYRPAVLTAKDDNSVGETISGSTGNPDAGGNYGDTGILCQIGSDVTDVHDLRISFKGAGITFDTSGTHQVRHTQFHKANTPLVAIFCTVRIQNVLMDQATSLGFSGTYATFQGEHITADQVNTLCSFTTSTLSLTNCLLASVTNWGSSFTSVNNATNNSGGVFQTVGGGMHYLADNTYRNLGTTNIDPALLADLKTKTTYPPIVYAQIGVSNDLVWAPQAQRDTDTPDLGYHYDPLDYAAGGAYLLNATLTVNPGTAIGTFGTNVYTYGVGIGPNGRLICAGAPDNLVRIAEYTTVQEQPGANWGKPTYASVTEAFSAPPSGLDFRFTDWSVLAQDAPHFFGGSTVVLSMRDCQFHNGFLETFNPTINFTNCLIERVYCDLEPEDAVTPIFRNNLVRFGTFGYWTFVNTAVIKDNLFDRAIIPDWLASWGNTYDGGFNAYVTNYDRFQPTFTNDVILSAPPAYQAGPLGAYYYPTNLTQLLNAGSVSNAALVGLYHYTTTTNQVKETNSVVDIGFHYVAVNANGTPLDYDGDGVPDYLEDANGNGDVDSGETDWRDPNDLGLKVIITRPRNNSTIP